MNDATFATLSPSGHTDGFARASLPPPHAWPEFRFDLPELHYPPRLNCVAALLDGAVKLGWGGRTALIGARERLSYAELLARVDRIAHVLRHDLGLATGNRVLVRGANCPTMAACILGVIKAGCIAVPTMPLLRARELDAIADKARINAVLCAGGLVGEVEALGLAVPVLVFDAPVADCLEQRMARHDAPFAAADTAADDVCLISFTSGTTGVPKGTMHFHRDVLAICDCFPRHVLRARADDVFIGTPPLAFTFGLGGLLLFPLRVGAAGVLIEKLSPEALLGAIAEHRATVCFTAPTFYRQMAAQAGRFSLDSLRASVSAGEALPVATREAWQAATGLAMIDGIGATELLHIFIASADGDVRPGATGKPVPGYQACILDAQGRRVGPGVIGRLAVKGPTGCRYLADERQHDYVQDGWNLTGDAYEMDDDGYFYYRSRTDDMIISAGYNIAGAEVEEALLHHPAVAECAVVGRSDPERGQVVEAHVVLRGSHVGTEELAHELQEFVKGQIAPYKYPRAILFKEQLPRTETGKLQRFKLRTEAV
ncbi:AMP-binding protein [Massilia sp. CFBP9026]|uniref:AMP-binding protein n=1 Tax=Massilia sp. CFBP9026 TaxID=3096536 RepID=UPI002A6B5065|nr:AMP-binding protein [Massilia sp. CFBP9026]MDY0965057.1 AMP-binding protein [Massilia sp. CFBP9026]